MSGEKSWDQYGPYLHLDKVLNAQYPRSAAAGDSSHDEMLFIQFHQIYELWFKQILFELDDVCLRLSSDVVDEKHMQPILTYLGRVVEIFKQMENMVDVLETMPPQSFVDFRDYLGTASGFQSEQFRLIETRLGLLREDRLCVFHDQFDANLCPASRVSIAKAESKPSLFTLIDRWLARMPFIRLGNYQFWDAYRVAVNGMFQERIQVAKTTFSGERVKIELDAIERGQKKFDGIFDSNATAENTGRWRMSWQALQAALFIMIYRDEPVLQAPYAVLMRVMDLDELIARWRLRHALMVQRMVGMSMGTGGSSGYEYLLKTVDAHRIFTDLAALSAYLIPSRMLPKLPEELCRQMDYQYAVEV